MAVVLALCSALAYGLSDFIGGIVSRRTSAWAVAVLGQTSSVVCTGLVAFLWTSGHAEGQDFAWAALAGVGSGTGVAFLYRGFAAGRMSVVAPVSAVGAAVVPVLAGTVTGERPSLVVWLGVLAALPGIWLVSTVPVDQVDSQAGAGRAGDFPRARASIAEGVVDGLLAGLGFGLLFAALGQVPDRAGLWPLALCQLVAVPSVVVLAIVLRTPWWPRQRAAGWALLAGPLGTAATLAFLLASQRGFLTVAGVLSSLYPASTVLLAALVLHERLHRAQGLGLVLCGVAVALVAAG